MKTIKELEEEVIIAKKSHCDGCDIHGYCDICKEAFARHSERIKALKDVLELIDELELLYHGCFIDAEELKARITG